MRKLTFLGILLLAFSVFGNAKQAERPLRLLYWNIQNGMWDGQNDNYDRFVEFVRKQDPDICVWCEAQSIWVTDSKEKMPEEERYLEKNWGELAARYGHAYWGIGAHRDNYPQVITSKYPITYVKQIFGEEPDHVVAHGAGWATIEVDGQTVNIVTVHTWPHPFAPRVKDREASKAKQGGDKYRAMEIKYICEQTIATVPGAKYQLWMMMGDFNSRSRLDNDYYAYDSKDPKLLVHDYILENTPYIDVIKGKYPTEFKPSIGTRKGRIDYVYCTKPLYDRITYADIIWDDYTTPVKDPGNTSFWRPSDHLPILVDFDLGASAVQAPSQTVPDNELSRSIRAHHAIASNNLHSYEFAPLHDSPAPNGYKPFYISHYGRHGSRSTGGDASYVRLKKQLLAAQSDGQLTADGERLLKASGKAVEGHDGMGGHLTPRGRREHAMLAERMYQRYREVFRNGSKKISAASSMVPRCIVSMTAFTNSLISLQKDLDIDVDTGEKYMKYLTGSANENTKAWGGQIQNMHGKDVEPDTVSIRTVLFKDPAASVKYAPNATRLQRDICRVAETAEAFDSDEDIYSLLPESVVYSWAEHTGRYIYLFHANSLEMGDIRIPIAAPLADDIVSRADEVIDGAPRAADLRFGHDWPLVAVCCYFGLEGIGDRMTLEEARGKWVAARYTPLAGNLQLIFYRKKGAPVLVKFLLNEKETLIPELKPVQGPYYRWTDVKDLLATRKRSS